jgi:MFS family permease
MPTSVTGQESAQLTQPLRRNRNFLKLWAGQGFSVFGFHIADVSVPLATVLLLNATAAQMGLLGTARWMPFLLFTLLVGVWADRVRRRPLLISADFVRAVIMGGIVAMAVTGILTMPVLLVAIFIFGVFTVVFDVAYYSYVPHIVTRAQLVPANSRLQGTYSVAQLGGPGLGGALVQLFTVSVALVINAIAFLASALWLLWIRKPEPKPEPPPGGHRNSLADIREGLQIVYRNAYLRALVGTAGTYNLFNQWILVLFVLYGVQEIGIGAAGVGLVLSAEAVGALIGAVAATRVSRWLGVGPAVVWAMILACPVMIAVPFVPGGTLLTLPLLMVIYAANGCGIAISSVAAVSVRQTVTPSRLLGRMTASYRFVSYGTIAIGALLGGVTGELLGLGPAILTGAIGMLTAIAWVVISPLRRLINLDDVAAEPDDATLQRS